MASSRSVVPAMGLLGVVGGAGAGGEVRTAASGVGSRTRSQHTGTQAPPSPLHGLSFLDLRATDPPTQLLPSRVAGGPPLWRGFWAWTC